MTESAKAVVTQVGCRRNGVGVEGLLVAARVEVGDVEGALVKERVDSRGLVPREALEKVGGGFDETSCTPPSYEPGSLVVGPLRLQDRPRPLQPGSQIFSIQQTLRPSLPPRVGGVSQTTADARAALAPRSRGGCAAPMTAGTCLCVSGLSDQGRNRRCTPAMRTRRSSPK